MVEPVFDSSGGTLLVSPSAVNPCTSDSSPLYYAINLATE
jgi:hypothetical protein